MSRYARLAIVCLLAGVPLFWGLATFPATPDGALHLQRVRALAEAFAAGVVLPRWFPDFAFGYGYPVLNYYAPGFYAGPALLVAAGLDVWTAVRVSLAVGFGLSAVGMVVLLRRFAAVGPALVGTVLFLVFPYRLYDLFVRGALPEFAAFLWLPWIAFWTLWGAEGGGGSARRGARGGALGVAPGPGEDAPPAGGVRAPAEAGVLAAGRLLPAALGWAGLVLTHNLTALMAAVAALVAIPAIALFWAQSSPSVPGGQGSARRTALAPAGDGAERSRRGYGRRLLGTGAVVLGPLVLGGLLSAWYWAPAIFEARWVGIGAGGEARGYADHFATVGTLFTFAPVFPYPPAAAATVPLPGFVLLLAGLGGAGLAAAWRRRGGGAGDRSTARILAGALAGALAGGLVAVWLTTASSAPVWAALEPILGKLQFPWRWQVIVGASLPLLLAAGWAAVSGAASRTGSGAGSRAESRAGSRAESRAVDGAASRPGSAAASRAESRAVDGAASRPASRAENGVNGAPDRGPDPAGGGQPAQALGGQDGWRRAKRFSGAAAWGVAGALLVAYATLGLRVAPASGAAADLTTRGMWAFDDENGQVGASWTAEFLPNTVTEQRWAIGRAPSDGSTAASQGAVAMAVLPRRLGYLGGTYAVTAGAPGRLIFHQFFFPAWRVTVDGVAVPAQPEGDLGLLAVDLPAGEHTVAVAWGATGAVAAGRALTAAGWALVLALLVAGAVGAAPVARAGRMAGAAHLRAREGQLAEGAHEGAHESAHAGAHETAHEAAPAGRVRGKSAYTGRVKSWPAVAAVAAWVSVGLLLVLGASGVTARSSVPQRVGADFDSVRLEAAEVGPVQAGQAGTEAGQAGTEAEAGRAQAGTVAPVRLYWSIQGPVEPLVAYVHVVDAAGVVVAQNDGPLGGEFTPAARWRPGLVVPHTHWVPLPRDLPPGEYQVLAGVYRPGDPGAPLVAAGAEAARVPVGVLKVRP